MLQIGLIFFLAFIVFLLEHIYPGRKLPRSKRWYIRAILLNLCQLGLIWIAGMTWNHWFQGHSLLHPNVAESPFIQGGIYWLFGTFIFYWWHRLRHQTWWWKVFHQVHHSPARIEMLTSFYKHPAEAAVNSFIISVIVYGIFGASVEVGAWYNVFAVAAEFFYHMNLQTPHWIGYFIQRPEQHSIHHERRVHAYNFGDLTIWDRLFGTFKDTNDFVLECGFAEHREERLLQMITFQDVQNDGNKKSPR